MALGFDPVAVAQPLSVLVVIGFGLGAYLRRREHAYAREVTAGTWGLFALFWVVLVPHYTLVQKSIVEGLGSLAAVPLSLYAGYLLWDGRDSLFVLSRAVAVMGLIYLPVSFVPPSGINPVQAALIDTVAHQTAWALSLFDVTPQLTNSLSFTAGEAVATANGYDPGTYEIPGKASAAEWTFVFLENDRPITYTIITACTGIGSIAIFAGGIVGVSAPWKRKARALALSVPIIYGLNIVRNTFIAIMFGTQRMQWFVGEIMFVFGLDDPQLVSYYVADRMLAQFGSVVALIAITYLVVRELPELLVIVEDLLYLVTRREYDLTDAVTD